MVKKYQRPSITTVVIPERTSYACNVGSSDPYGCPGTSAIVGQGICISATAFNVIGTGC